MSKDSNDSQSLIETWFDSLYSEMGISLTDEWFSPNNFAHIHCIEHDPTTGEANGNVHCLKASLSDMQDLEDAINLVMTEPWEQHSQYYVYLDSLTSQDSDIVQVTIEWRMDAETDERVLLLSFEDEQGKTWLHAIDPSTALLLAEYIHFLIEMGRKLVVLQGNASGYPVDVFRKVPIDRQLISTPSDEFAQQVVDSLEKQFSGA
ncbi:hypothetical protein SAMN02745216_03882 [Desulfatibacillum alkenivorans DSM 16219]|jgi:hypothetical protein|uniref:Uncharacterized protein n=1 Tax=Desulfatibacillum alkenivorans DSM 16219 TaxID=1121393 RepID=A0A1M6UEL2_9BACT|nr:hypothetical protein [Desulfatibacillum alkenivorans]SHK67607.1 hypothetical protein SAMN02745216_03882 [Desulfatibacillum alkenivorans DSM 16219]